jgi:hypothetical protein
MEVVFLPRLLQKHAEGLGAFPTETCRRIFDTFPMETGNVPVRFFDDRCDLRLGCAWCCGGDGSR